MSITGDYKKLKKQEQKLRDMQSESLESKIEASLPYVLKNGIDNFKNSSLENLYDDVLTFINTKNNEHSKEIQEKVRAIIAGAQQDREHFLFGEGDYTNLSDEEKMQLFSDKHKAFLIEIDEEPLYRMAYEIPQDEVLQIFPIQAHISREDFNDFKNLYTQIKEKNIEFINRNQNRESSESGLSVLKAYALEIEHMIKKSNILYPFRMYLNELLSKRNEYDSTFIPFQKDQIAGKDVQNKTEKDLIHSFVRELNADFNLKGEEKINNNNTELTAHQEIVNLLEEIKPGFKKILNNSLESHNHKQLNSELKPIVDEFYTPVLNILNSREISFIYAASTIVQRFYSALLPKENFIMDKDTLQFSYHKPVKEDHPFSQADNSNPFLNKNKTFTVYPDVIHSRSDNLRFFADSAFKHEYFPSPLIKIILDNFHRSIDNNSLITGNSETFITNFDKFDEIKKDIQDGFSRILIQSPSLQQFLNDEINIIKNINARHYDVRPNITVETSIDVVQADVKNETGSENISSLSSIKTKFSSLFDHNKNNNENKYKK